MAAYRRVTATGLSRAGATRVRVRRGQGRHQTSRHRGGLRREHLRKIGTYRQRGPQQVRGQHKRQRSLAVVAAGGQHHGRPRRLRRLGPELGDQPGLADTRLAGDRHHPARGAGRLPGRAQGGELGLPAHQRPDPAASEAPLPPPLGQRRAPRPRRPAAPRPGTTERAGGGPSRPARTSSYSRVVSGSGRTARSRSSTRTSDRYCRMAAERWPVQPCSRMIAWWAGSCRGSSCSQRRACPVARSRSPSAMHAATSRCSPRASDCRSPSLTETCHSSKSGQPRKTKPDRKSSRYSWTARSRDSASGRAISRLELAHVHLDRGELEGRRRPG